MSGNQSALQHAVLRACELDVQALKPGNVNINAPGHGMNAADFFASAAAITEPITEPSIGVGERIYLAIEATQRVVSCNTNLGIVLLLAPMIQAMQVSSDTSLQFRIRTVLSSLTLNDAHWAYRAIRLAKPGGLGEGREHDVAQPAQITLLQAMAQAVDRDQIAALYCDGFGGLYQHNLPVWRDALGRFGSPEWAATAVFLESLARQPDSLIARKHGEIVSADISRQAAIAWQGLKSAMDYDDEKKKLERWDVELKAARLNPGTTADITVATIFLADLQDMR